MGTDHARLNDVLAAFIPSLGWPISYSARSEAPETATCLDLVDFIGQRIAKPEPFHYHSFYRHHELRFDVSAGEQEFRNEVNGLFARSRLAYEVGADMQVRRLGPSEARQLLVDLDPDSRDANLDELIREARRRFLSRAEGDQQVAIEKLWDAFERLKTIEPGTDKKAATTALLGRVAANEWRSQLDAEMHQLTKIGNTMTIRHHETDKEPIPITAVDYLFVRMASLILYLLRATGRLRT